MKTRLAVTAGAKIRPIGSLSGQRLAFELDGSITLALGSKRSCLCVGQIRLSLRELGGSQRQLGGARIAQIDDHFAYCEHVAADCDLPPIPRIRSAAAGALGNAR